MTKVIFTRFIQAITIGLFATLHLSSCEGPEGEIGEQGIQGETGQQGEPGKDATEYIESGYAKGTLTGKREDGENFTYTFNYNGVDVSEPDFFRVVSDTVTEIAISRFQLIETDSIIDGSIYLYLKVKSLDDLSEPKIYALYLRGIKKLSNAVLFIPDYEAEDSDFEDENYDYEFSELNYDESTSRLTGKFTSEIGQFSDRNRIATVELEFSTTLNQKIYRIAVDGQQ